jgi:hypothetical protein
MNRPFALGLLGIVALIGGIYLYQNLGCTLAGCDTAVLVTHNQRLDTGTYNAEVCVGDTCATRQYEVTDPDSPRREVQVSFGDAQFSGNETVTLTVTDQAGSVVLTAEDEVQFERSQPNGWRCPPVCWFGEMVL